MKDKILAVARETIETLGYVPVELRINPAKQTRVFKVVIHKKNGNVSIDDCATVANVLSRRLDMVVPGFSESHDMTVESPGVDRKLANLDECMIFDDRDIRFILKDYEFYGLKENVLVARAISMENGILTVQAKSGEYRLKSEDVASAKLDFDFKKYLR